jgi:hypothetical protein
MLSLLEALPSSTGVFKVVAQHNSKRLKTIEASTIDSENCDTEECDQLSTGSVVMNASNSDSIYARDKFLRHITKLQKYLLWNFLSFIQNWICESIRLLAKSAHI